MPKTNISREAETVDQTKEMDRDLENLNKKLENLENKLETYKEEINSTTVNTIRSVGQISIVISLGLTGIVGLITLFVRSSIALSEGFILGGLVIIFLGMILFYISSIGILFGVTKKYYLKKDGFFKLI